MYKVDWLCSLVVVCFFGCFFFVFCWQSESAATSTSAAMSAQINHPAVKRRQLGSKKSRKGSQYFDGFVTPSR